MKVTKAVIPLGGLATRFLPASKSVPKEMFPVIDKPIIQYLVEELSEAGITDILFLIGRGRESLLNHFDKNPELNEHLFKNEKYDLLEPVNKQNKLANCHYIRCYETNGVAKALLYGENFVGSSPFVVLFGDEMFYNKDISATKQMLNEFEKTNKAVIGCVNVKKEYVSKYGIVDIETKDGVDYVKNMVEKPQPEEAPSTLASVGKYVLTSDIFEIIKNNKVLDRERNFTQALTELAKQNNLVCVTLDGERYDTGSKLGYILANINYALKDETIKESLLKEMKSIIEKIDK